VLPLNENAAPAPELGSLAAYTEQAVLHSTPRFSLLVLRDALDPEGAKVHRAFEEEGSGELRAAQVFLDQLDSQQASAQADRAIAALEHTDLTRNFGKLIRARVLKLAAQLANGETRAVHQGLEALIYLQPKVELPANYFTPEVLARAAQLRRDASRVAIGKLEVQTTPPGASVYVDGQYRGVAPMVVTGLTPVEHQVSVAAPGYALEQDRGRRGGASFVLRPAQGLPRYQAFQEKLRKATSQKERFAQARLFAQSLGADQALLISVRPDLNPGRAAVTLVRMDVQKDQSLGYQQLAVDRREPAGAQAEQSLHWLLNEEGGVGLPPPEAEAPRRTSSSPQGVFTLSHVLLGAGALLVIAGVSFGVAALSQQHQYSQVNTIGASAARPYQEAGQRAALISDVLNGLGIVGLGVGGYLTLTELEEPSSTIDVLPPAPPERGAEK
jgi:hypothetical protein